MTEGFVKILKNNGYRITSPRVKIIRQIKKIPLSAKEIHENLNDKSIDLVTVYRTLELLTSLGLLTKTTLDGNVVKYEALNYTHHHHLVCEKCGRVKDIQMEDEQFFKKIMKKYDFNVSSHSLEFLGRCSRCA